jgi:hypothetical protein
MKSHNHLSETDLAVFYLQQTGSTERMPGNAMALVDSVNAWLRQSRLEHRLDDAVDIAIDANEIAKQVRARAPAPSEAEIAFRDNVQFGTMADDVALRQAEELALAGQVEQNFRAEAGSSHDIMPCALFHLRASLFAATMPQIHTAGPRMKPMKKMAVTQARIERIKIPIPLPTLSFSIDPRPGIKNDATTARAALCGCTWW